MDIVKALLVFFVLTGLTEVASEVSPSALAANEATPAPTTGARLGPPTPGGSGTRHVDSVTKPIKVALR
ncbi:MAG TPA: hypothetical protein VGM44_07890 [Polyangiaceae bacterium]|jgi:hypothetical protein